MSEVLWRRLGYMLSPQLDIYQHIAPKVGGRVLDVGFGTGFGTFQLTRCATHVVGIELDQEAVRFADANIPGVYFAWGDIGRGAAYLGKFDCALMIEVLEHIEDWRQALANVREVLEPGGRLFISARNANADLRKNDLHEREWTALEFAEALEECGFSDVTLYDYKLEEVQDWHTRQTPLVAIATKGR